MSKEHGKILRRLASLSEENPSAPIEKPFTWYIMTMSFDRYGFDISVRSYLLCFSFRVYYRHASPLRSCIHLRSNVKIERNET